MVSQQREMPHKIAFCRQKPQTQSGMILVHLIRAPCLYELAKECEKILIVSAEKIQFWQGVPLSNRFFSIDGKNNKTP